MIQRWPEWDTVPELIVPVPLHPRRQRARGFNQALLLARELSAAKEIALNEHALRRVRNTRAQIDLTPQQRLANVHNAFSADALAVRGKHILLVDDVYTTGATMNSAARTLFDQGAAVVSAYCLARPE